MENQVFKNLQIAVFREQLMNIKNHNNIIDIVETMKDKVSFDILICLPSFVITKSVFIDSVNNLNSENGINLCII